MTSHVRPPRLAGLAADRLDLWNALVSHCGAPLALTNAATSVQVDVGEAPSVGSSIAMLQPASGPLLLVQMLRFPFQDQFGVDLEIADVEMLPEPLRRALTAGMASLLSRILVDHRLGDLALQGLGALGDMVGEDERKALCWWSVAISGIGAEKAELKIGCSRADLLAFAAGDLTAARANWPALRRQLTTDGHFTIGRLPLPLSQLDKLRPGALIVMRKTEPGTVAVRFAQVILVCMQTDGGLTCLRVETIDGEAGGAPGIVGTGVMTADSTDDAHGHALPAALDIMLDFDLGRVAVPLADLESWTPGSIVALQQQPRADGGVEVTIRANGRAIGVGDIVEVDDRLAVRVTRLSISG